MLAPVNDYYTDKEYEYALRQMRKAMERQRILTEARLAQTSLKAVKTEFNTNVEQSAHLTKSSLQMIQGQLDTAIKGAVRDKLERVIEEKLPMYDQIIG